MRPIIRYRDQDKIQYSEERKSLSGFECMSANGGGEWKDFDSGL